MYRRMVSLLALALVLNLVSDAAADLVGHWRFDGNLDDSVGAANGTFNGGSPLYVTGRIGQGIEFDGVNDFAHLPSANPSAYTITLWVRPARTNAASVIARTSNLGPTTHWSHQLRINPQGVFHHYLWVGSERNLAGTTLVEADTWYHVAIAAANNGPMQLYVNGEEDAPSIGVAGTLWGEGDRYYVGSNSGHGMGWFQGVVDDVQIYDTILTAEEIGRIAASSGGFPLAFGPNPKDGALHADTWVTLSWKAGDFAVSHDVYLGDNFADVNGGTHESGTFRGNQALTYYVAGFPGFAYPDGLVPGTTYYWRIDEVNNADPNSPWKGPVWRFSIPPKKAYNPAPADGAKFIALDPTLSWTAGFGAKLHTVYFGPNFDTVSNAAGGLPQGTTSYKPAGPLQPDTTYYWRVDEFDAAKTHKGDVWSFKTAKVGGGVKGQYFKGMDFNTLVLTRTDPQINFNWGAAAPDPVVGVDQFSVRWTGEVEAAFTETYTFYARADDGVRLWVDGNQLVDAWIDQGATEYSGKLDLVAGNTYSVQMEMYENGGDAVAELRWSSPHTPKQPIPQAALSPPVKASGPNPGNGATGTSLTPVLTWNPGDFAASHDVYFGMDAQAVKNAGKTSPEYKGSKALGAESYSPGKLAWFTTYYWRVDEVNNVHTDSPWVGNLWSFTTGDFLLIDDFESYDTGDNQIWYAWHDGLGYGAPGTPPYFAGNGTGAAVGDETTASFTEETIVHGGRKSMPLAYDNNKTGFAKYSEAEFKLTAPRDWTEESVGELSIWFRGLPGSVGSFTEAPAGTFTMTASGTDIWDVGTAGNYRDEFHYAYKTLTGAGSIVARVQSVQNTDGWAKAGVMIRETLDAGSKHAFGCITPSNGVGSQGRDTTGGASFNTNQTGVAAPRWLKLERDAAGNFTVSHSANGTAWSPVTGATPRNIPMATTVYIGLAVTAHNAALTCQAVFTNVTTTGTVSPQWAHQDIGIASNTAEPLYVAVSNAAGQPAVVVHSDPAAAQITTWTEWVIPLQSLAAQGITLTNVDKIALGLGTRGNMTTPGGSGKMYFDDIRLYRPRP